MARVAVLLGLLLCAACGGGADAHALAEELRLLRHDLQQRPAAHEVEKALRPLQDAWLASERRHAAWGVQQQELLQQVSVALQHLAEQRPSANAELLAARDRVLVLAATLAQTNEPSTPDAWQQVVGEASERLHALLRPSLPRAAQELPTPDASPAFNVWLLMPWLLCAGLTGWLLRARARRQLAPMPATPLVDRAVEEIWQAAESLSVAPPASKPMTKPPLVQFILPISGPDPERSMAKVQAALAQDGRVLRRPAPEIVCVDGSLTVRCWTLPGISQGERTHLEMRLREATRS